MFQKSLLLLLSALFLLLTGICRAQDTTAPKNIAKALITADSLSTGTYKDIFASFFQLAAKDLTGPSKSITFTTNPYALMLRHDSTLATYKSYKKYTALRNLNFTVGAKLDSSYRFNGMTASLTYAIWNGRDVTVAKTFLHDLNNNKLALQFFQITDSVNSALSNIPTTDPRLKKYDSCFRALKDSSVALSKLDAGFQKWFTDTVCAHIGDSSVAALDLQKLMKDPKFGLYTLRTKPYDSVYQLYQNRGLWTIGVSDTSYSNAVFSKNVAIASEYLKGLTDPKHTYSFQLDIKAAVNFADDTLQEGKNLAREIFTFTPGLNFALNGSQTHQPWLEFEISGSYNNVWKGLYNKENQIVNTINGTLRILVTNNIWIPIQISYNPKNGNVFGLLNVTTSFTGLSSLVSGKKAN